MAPLSPWPRVLRVCMLLAHLHACVRGCACMFVCSSGCLHACMFAYLHADMFALHVCMFARLHRAICASSYVRLFGVGSSSPRNWVRLEREP